VEVFSNAWVRRDSVSTLDALNGGAVALKRANLTGEVGDNESEEEEEEEEEARPL
jgi:hypothetical protein